jgi:hypothetical protein
MKPSLFVVLLSVLTSCSPREVRFLEFSPVNPVFEANEELFYDGVATKKIYGGVATKRMKQIIIKDVLIYLDGDYYIDVSTGSGKVSIRVDDCIGVAVDSYKAALVVRIITKEPMDGKTISQKFKPSRAPYLAATYQTIQKVDYGKVFSQVLHFRKSSGGVVLNVTPFDDVGTIFAALYQDDYGPIVKISIRKRI